MDGWTKKQIDYMHDALRFSDYYQVIAAHIAPHLAPGSTLCDAGCGLGELGLALLPRCRSVTCVDIAPAAIRDLESRAPAGIMPLCGNVAECPPAVPYDAMVFCLFGSTGEALAIAGAQCRGKVFLIKRNYVNHRFSTDTIPIGDHTAEHTARELAAWGIPFFAEDFTAELGQPFRSMTDAREFFSLYNRSEHSITDEELRSRLCSGPTEEFPLFLPQKKQLRLFTIETENIP